MNLGTYLKSLRENHKVDKSPTLQEVAGKVGVTVGGLHQIEAGGVKSPDVKTLVSLAEYYRVPLKSLIDKIGK